ncbi:MAG TPA: sigma-70 family RNA polymerase sigma factor [Acidimicrobiales bacterium]|nr:sigma-70 family RNA polymerase sigma factor [Acidimicrobiales bacterium]
MSPVATAEAVAVAVAEAHRREWAFVLAATVRLTRDIDLAEECVQHAYAKALSSWPERGIPGRAGAWLTTVARRRALDLARHAATQRRRLPLLLGEDMASEGAGAERLGGSDPWSRVGEEPEIADDRLRLVFVCCHPALSEEAKVALTLRLVCGLSTVEVARAFLVSEPTMAARITRAKKKIAAAGIPFQVPASADLPERLDAVLSVVHLVYTTGHTAPSGADLVRRDLVARACDLARMLWQLLPGEAEVAALLALVLLSDARTPGRVDADGRLVLLADQDRSRWDRRAIAEGVRLLRLSDGAGEPGRFALMASIAAIHSCAPTFADTDWAQLVRLYDRLAQRWPSPVVALNRAVAIGYSEGPSAGLAALEPLAGEPMLAAYHYLPSARAELLRGVGRIGEARCAYEEALALATNDVEREHLAGRLAQLG